MSYDKVNMHDETWMTGQWKDLYLKVSSISATNIRQGHHSAYHGRILNIIHQYSYQMYPIQLPPELL